jgi:hypothetical protein
VQASHHNRIAGYFEINGIREAGEIAPTVFAGYLPICQGIEPYTAQGVLNVIEESVPHIVPSARVPLSGFFNIALGD